MSNPQRNNNSEATLFSDFDLYLFREGKHFHLYNKLGSHVITHDGQKGTYFALWAPNAEYVAVVGDFNDWDREKNPMKLDKKKGTTKQLSYTRPMKQDLVISAYKPSGDFELDVPLQGP
jgi:1,4-alpha-glucan branching enzyme